MDKKARKKADKQCYFCNESNYSLLDVHRIKEGSKGGKYTYLNSIVCCSNCHRKIHAGEIKTIRKYLSTSGKYVLHYIENGVERFN